MSARASSVRTGFILGAAALFALVCPDVSSHTTAHCNALGHTEGRAIDTAARSDDLLETAAAIYLASAEELSPENGYPRSLSDGVNWDPTRPDVWTSGFFAGILWMLYDYFEDDAFVEPARRWTEGLAQLSGDDPAPSHDIGFIANCSYGRGHGLIGSDDYRAVLVRAAEGLAARFDPNVGAIKSWGAIQRLTYPVIIDNLMNLELLYWAARNGGSDSLAYVATTHAMTTMRDHVREDGTTFHVVDYDPETGEAMWRGTVQGLADTSTWARGQAWAVYGFTMAHRETGDELLLETACRVADAFIDGLPDDGIPCWDFDAEPWPVEPKDASAGAIAASGLWELAALVGEPQASEKYRAVSLALVDRLSEEDYSAAILGMPALLHHSTGNRPLNVDIDIPMIYADYYFIEAMIRQTYTACASLPGPTLINYPNPFNPSTTIRYELPTASDVTLGIYDVSGRLVTELLRSEPQRLGPHTVRWDGRDATGCRLASGVYFCRIRADGSSAERKILLLK